MFHDMTAPSVQNNTKPRPNEFHPKFDNVLKSMRGRRKGFVADVRHRDSVNRLGCEKDS